MSDRRFDAEACAERHRGLWRYLGVWTAIFSLFAATIVGIALAARIDAKEASGRTGTIEATTTVYRAGLERQLSAIEKKLEIIDDKIDKIRVKP